MIEVETKIKITDPKYWRNFLMKYASYKGKELKIDEYYTLQQNGYPKKSLRIRKRNGAFEINFKHPLNFKDGVFAKKETEFSISDPKGFIALIKDFGYKRWLTKIKHTEIFEIKRNFHIELNKLEGLGWFLEIEYLCEKDEVIEARKKIQNVLIDLGFSEKDVVKKGYTKLLSEKNH